MTEETAILADKEIKSYFEKCLLRDIYRFKRKHKQKMDFDFHTLEDVKSELKVRCLSAIAKRQEIKKMKNFVRIVLAKNLSDVLSVLVNRRKNLAKFKKSIDAKLCSEKGRKSFSLQLHFDEMPLFEVAEILKKHLSVSQTRIIEMHCYGNSTEKIGSILKLKPTTVERKLRKAKETLKKTLKN